MWTERSKKYFPWPEVRVVSVKCCVYQEHGEHRATGARRPRPPRRHSTAARGREARRPPLPPRLPQRRRWTGVPAATSGPVASASSHGRSRHAHHLFARGAAMLRHATATRSSACRTLDWAYRKRSLEFNPNKGASSRWRRPGRVFR